MLELFMTSLKKNPKKIKAMLTNKGEDIVTNGTMSILFPIRYDNVGLIVIGDTIKLFASFIIVTPDNDYYVVNRPVIITTEPSSIDTVKLNGEEHTMLTYYAGSKVVVNRNLIKDDSFVFDVFNEFYIKGNVPVYLEYEDLIYLFLSVREYTDSNISDNSISMEILVSLLARSKDDTTVYLRQAIKNKSEASSDKFKFVALSSTSESFNNSLSRFVGPRLKEGLDSMLVRDADSANNIEKILLK